MNYLLNLYLGVLFIAFVPGVLVTLPKGGAKYTVLAVHALLFALVWHFTRKMVSGMEGFQGASGPGLNAYKIDSGKAAERARAEALAASIAAAAKAKAAAAAAAAEKAKRDAKNKTEELIRIAETKPCNSDSQCTQGTYCKASYNSKTGFCTRPGR